MRGIALIALAASACRFSPGALPADAAIDGPPPITVGFAKDTTQTDEGVGTESVRVVLSKPADEAISVAYAVTGGTADRPNDYLLTDGTITFAPGDVEETIDITIGPDGMEEPDETIELTLSNATGGAGLASSAHVVTINANLLPRVTFSMASSNANENASPLINAVLDVASALTTSVEVAVTAGTATGAGTDYTLGTTIVTFNPGETTKPVTLTVHEDTLDEQNEDVTLGLANAINLIIGTIGTTTHTINDNDDPPTVAFAMSASSIREGGVQIDIAVTVTPISGKNFNVPFAIDSASTATGGGTDYMLVTTSPITFPAGTATQNIRINIVDDTAIESAETVVLTLGTPSPMPNATLGTTTTHTLTIADNDSTCLGAGAFALCFPTPANAVNVSGALDTDNSPLCASAPPLSGWAGGPSSCFIVGTDVTIAATQVTGGRVLVVFASGDISVTGDLDVASHRGGTSGPGSNVGCAAYTDDPSNDTSGAGGGAGGTFRTVGGDGGEGNGANNSGGSAIAAGSAPTTLRSGCTGQKGGDGFGGAGNNGGDPGAGGGALYMVAGGTLSVATGVTVNASGAGATALTSPDAGLFGGGGGGGSGGMIKLHATAFSVSGARFMANGGGGSSGADSDTPGSSGSDPSTTTPTAGGTPGAGGGAGANGGRGFGTTTATAFGSDGNSNNAGGGGGGGGGYIASNLTLTDAFAVSAGDIDP